VYWVLGTLGASAQRAPKAPPISVTVAPDAQMLARAVSLGARRL
jgi:hypothetical protein